MQCLGLLQRLIVEMLLPGPLLDGAVQLLVGHVAPVQPVVLHHEQHVKQNGKQAQAELGRVPEDGSPVVVVVADEKHLEDGEGAAREVEEDVTDAPAHCTLAPEKKIER